MQIAVTAAKENCLQISSGNPIENKFLSGPCATRAGLESFRPVEYCFDTAFRRLHRWQGPILELYAPVIFCDVSRLTRAEGSRIRRLSYAFSWACRVIARHRE